MPCDCEEQVNDALCQMGAALSVLEMHAERVQSPEISAVRDLLHRYHEEAHHAAGLVHMAAPVVCLLNDLSLNLGGSSPWSGGSMATTTTIPSSTR
ncbi:hypothetical protein [Delftia tsuruhatensis]|uniref:hypothetical protein n=1 Tax=Delftia tsuruhatensis TaxID=180282 RepID=UPI0028AF23FC|nr:hypothetical protein [Delftia tsuruhatensis]